MEGCDRKEKETHPGSCMGRRKTQIKFTRVLPCGWLKKAGTTVFPSNINPTVSPQTDKLCSLQILHPRSFLRYPVIPISLSKDSQLNSKGGGNEKFLPLLRPQPVYSKLPQDAQFLKPVLKCNVFPPSSYPHVRESRIWAPAASLNSCGCKPGLI